MYLKRNGIVETAWRGWGAKANLATCSHDSFAQGLSIWKFEGEGGVRALDCSRYDLAFRSDLINVLGSMPGAGGAGPGVGYVYVRPTSPAGIRAAVRTRAAEEDAASGPATPCSSGRRTRRRSPGRREPPALCRNGHPSAWREDSTGGHGFSAHTACVGGAGSAFR